MGQASRGLLDDEDVADAAKGVDVAFTINPEYAARLEHNKQREEWHRIKEKNPRLAARIEAKAAGADIADNDADASEKSSDDDDDDDDDEEELADQAKIDARFFNVLSRIRQKDQSIYDSSAQIYPESESEDGEEGDHSSRAASRKAHLKDVLARQALEGYEESASEGDEADGRQAQRGPTYVEEQQQLRQAFLQEVAKAEGGLEADQDGFGGVLKHRKRAAAADEPQSQALGDAEATQKVLDDYFGADEAQLGEGDRFLKKFIANKGWLEQEEGGRQGYGTDDEEDEEYIEQAERFESAYNHRFEEPGGASMVTYPRQLEGGVRKADSRRRAQREAAAQRRAAEAAAEEEQVKRLKSAKRREIDERLARIKVASGSEAAERLLKDILGKADFDLEEYDKAMAAAFDDEYYGEEDQDLEEDGGDDDADEPPMLDSLPEIEEIGEEAEGVDVGAEKQELMQLADEYSKLDAEDIVGGVRTRFRYREVPAADYGLNILDILRAPEKALNQVIGLKRLAPYRDDGGRFRPNMAKLKDMQGAAELPGQKSGRAAAKGAKRQSFQREQHNSRAPHDDVRESTGAAFIEDPASLSDPVAKTQKITQTKQADTGAAADITAALHSDQQPRKQSMKQKAAAGASQSPAQQTAADGSERAGNKKGRRPAPENKGAHELTAEERARSRLASFAKPTLAGPSSSGMPDKKRKKKQERADKAGAEAAPPAVPEELSGPKLTKAQKKNLWRAKRRALQHGLQPLV